MSDIVRDAVLTCVLFAASIAAGVVLTVVYPAAGQQLLEIFREAILGEVIGSSAPVLAVTLFLNNLQACLIMFLGGASFGILTAFVIVSNGFIIGSIVELIRQQEGALYIAAALLPHGIFEIPAFIISGTLGFLLARSLWNEWNLQGDAGADASRMGRAFLLYVIPLVILAAFTEAFITPGIIAFVS
jgi:stage II sporulation protein M